MKSYDPHLKDSRTSLADVVCIYGTGSDAFAAAWAVRRKYLSARFFADGLSGAVPDVTGKNVILVGTGHSRGVILKMTEVANTITVIDRHPPTIEDLNSLADVHNEKCPIELVLDARHSVAMLTWVHFFGDETPPELLSQVEEQVLLELTPAVLATG